MHDDSIIPGARQFATTHWTLVGRAAAQDTLAAEALERLCRDYWYPLYAFVRRRGHSAADAQDLTQSFFASLIEKNTLAQADRARGRLRSFLLAALTHFLANEQDKKRTLKRGGGRILEWDALDAEERYAAEPSSAEGTPEKVFDRRWAFTLVDRALKQLREAYAAAGKAELFDALRGSLTGNEPPRAETMQKLGFSESALKTAVHRLRHQYREILRAEVSRTVSEEGEIEAEMRHLAALLRQG